MKGQISPFHYAFTTQQSAQQNFTDNSVTVLNSITFYYKLNNIDHKIIHIEID